MFTIAQFAWIEKINSNTVRQNTVDKKIGLGSLFHAKS